MAVLSVLAKLVFAAVILYLGIYHFRSFSFPGTSNVTLRAFATEAEAWFFSPAVKFESVLSGKEVRSCDDGAEETIGWLSRNQAFRF